MLSGFHNNIFKAHDTLKIWCCMPVHITRLVIKTQLAKSHMDPKSMAIKTMIVIVVVLIIILITNSNSSSSSKSSSNSNNNL